MSQMFTLGADPEVFVRKNGKPISAYGLVPGTKASPYKTDLGAYQVDGMALEFNINPTALHDFENFNLNIVKTMEGMKKMAGVNFAKEVTVQDFDPEYLEAQPDEAKELGCDPDYNAYTLEPNPRPNSGLNFRTAAGHIHVGWGADIPIDNDEHIEICANFVKMLDATVGMYMTFIDREPRRRELYGKAGAMRVKPYGVEYRTPSNVWIWNRNRRLVMHRMLNLAINYMTQGVSPTSITSRNLSGGVSEEDIIRIINEGDFLTAKLIVDNQLGWDVARTAWTKIKQEMDKRDDEATARAAETAQFDELR